MDGLKKIIIFALLILVQAVAVPVAFAQVGLSTSAHASFTPVKTLEQAEAEESEAVALVTDKALLNQVEALEKTLATH